MKAGESKPSRQSANVGKVSTAVSPRTARLQFGLGTAAAIARWRAASLMPATATSRTATSGLALSQTLKRSLPFGDGKSIGNSRFIIPPVLLLSSWATCL